MTERVETAQEQLEHERRLVEIANRTSSVANAVELGSFLDKAATASVPPVLWEVDQEGTRNLLCAGPADGLKHFGRVLLRHCVKHAEYWDVAMMMPGTPEAELREMLEGFLFETRQGSRGYFRGHANFVAGDVAGSRRLLVGVLEPVHQEVVSLLAALARTVGKSGARVSVAVLTGTPEALPNALVRELGFRVALTGSRATTSKDVVGDESAKKLPDDVEGTGIAAVVYDKERGRREVLLREVRREELDRQVSEGQSN